MTDKEKIEQARKLAEAHWNYTEQILLQELEQKHYLYVEAMIHGYGHGYEFCEKKLKDEYGERKATK